MDTPHPSQSGDHLLNTYFPDADESTREAAREAFRKYAHAVLKLGTRLAQEQRIAAREDSPKQPDGVILRVLL